jgi:hypothetical protein
MDSNPKKRKAPPIDEKESEPDSGSGSSLAAKRARETSPKDGQVNHEAVKYDPENDIDILAVKVRGNFRHSGLVSSCFSTLQEFQTVIARNHDLVPLAKEYVRSPSKEDGRAL